MFSRGVLAACFVVALGSVGCGDDEDPPATNGGTGGTSGTGAGTGGTGGGTSGSGGRAGAGTGGGAAPTAAQCIASVGMITANRIAPACATCLCNMNLTATNACNAMPMCWALIGCIGDNCPDNPTSCALTSCMASIGGSTQAMPVGDVLNGPCAAMCDRGGDGGAPDAGL